MVNETHANYSMHSDWVKRKREQDANQRQRWLAMCAIFDKLG